MIDFHAHIDLFSDPKAVVRRCAELGIYVVSVTNTPSAWEQTAALAEGAPRIRTALGLHPQLARERKGELALFGRHIGRTRYVGEIGLDGSPDCRVFWQDQLDVFTEILQVCSRIGGRILTIHSRRAASEVLRILKKYPDAGVPILHWFTGTERELREASEMGCWFSIGPAMLASARSRAQIERMPSGRVLTESDGPFAQRHGGPLYPWDVQLATPDLATIWNMPVGDAQERLLSNLKVLAEVDAAARA